MHRHIGLAGVVLSVLVGAVVGGSLIFELLDVELNSELAEVILIRWIDIAVALIGAVIVVLLSGLFCWQDKW